MPITYLNDKLFPLLKMTEQRPVMFYIYGGGFYNGSNIDHPPNYLLEKDIVLVVPNYRIGALGWLSTKSENMPGNAPVSDLYVALQWVQDYIHLFGGDPKQVTIFGQSAGTTMSGSLLFSPRTPETYFQRSIQQSGSIFSSWAFTRNPLEQAERICKAVGCSFCDNIDLLYACLRNVAVPKILEVTEEVYININIFDVHKSILVFILLLGIFWSHCKRFLWYIASRTGRVNYPIK